MMERPLVPQIPKFEPTALGGRQYGPRLSEGLRQELSRLEF